MLVITTLRSMPHAINIQSTNRADTIHNYVNRLRQCPRVESDVHDGLMTIDVTDCSLTHKFTRLGNVGQKLEGSVDGLASATKERLELGSGHLQKMAALILQKEATKGTRDTGA